MDLKSLLGEAGRRWRAVRARVGLSAGPCSGRIIETAHSGSAFLRARQEPGPSTLSRPARDVTDVAFLPARGFDSLSIALSASGRGRTPSQLRDQRSTI